MTNPYIIFGGMSMYISAILLFTLIIPNKRIPYSYKVWMVVWWPATLLAWGLVALITSWADFIGTLEELFEEE